jgi:hypothetical protein
MGKCIAITTRGNKCKNGIQIGNKCCNVHKDQTPIPFYNRPDQNWPSAEVVNTNTFRYYTMEVVMTVLYNYNIDMHISSLHLFNSPVEMDRAKKRCLILSVEHIKRNRHLLYGLEYLNDLIVCQYNLLNCGHLAEYAENFRRLCLKSYRDESRKKLITFYFKHVEGLYVDVVEHIMSFY